MSTNSFEDKLQDLKLSNEELKRFSDAFQNEEFRKLFLEYAEELNDPKNRELYEQEIRAVEEQRGSDVTFVHPNPGHVLKTTINGKTKCFINIATNEHVEKPSYTKTNGTNGKQGANWSLPHCLAGPHEDIDHDSKMCTVYDVIFSPDTYRMAETNEKFMKMVEDSALDSVENNYHCQLDRNNVKRLKLKFKGTPKSTIIRRKKEDDTGKDLKQETDEIIDKAISSTQNHKVVLSSHNRPVAALPPSSNPDPVPINTPHTDENGFTIPLHRIIHRGEFDMQDCTNSMVTQVRSMRPKELLIEVDLPLCASTNNVDLDVCERSLKLHCDSPKYFLDLSLPYPVRESDSHARFDKKQRKLLITLAVIKETPIVIEIDSDAEMEEDVKEEPTERIPTATMDQPVSTNEISSNASYTEIPFEYKQGLARVALVLYVKNVDQSSLKLENDGQHITIQLSSLGSGFYPLHHQLCLDFDEPLLFATDDDASIITFNADNVLILLKKTSNNNILSPFSSGIDRENMKTNDFVLANTAEKVNPSTTTTTTTAPMTKEDFLVDRSDSSNSDQQKKLSKKQAKKLAKETRKHQPGFTSEENEKLTKKIAKITLQSQHEDGKFDEWGKMLSEEKDDHLAEMANVTPHPSIYRRHMSESQVDSEAVSNGEFKLKGILKNSTKFRSYSESFNDFDNGDFQSEEPVFERCSTTDDLTSSNENNSIVTSPDSTSGGGSSSLGTTPGSSANVKHVTFNNQVSRKTFKPGGPVSGMKKMTTTQQRKLKKRKRQDSLNSQSSDQDDGTSGKPPSDYKNPVEFQDVISWQAAGQSQSDPSTTPRTKSAVQFTNPLIFELDN